MKVEESLSTIFRDEAGDLPDLSKLERRRKNPWVWVIGFALFIVLLIAVAWAGFLIFKPFRGFQGQGLVMQIDGPQKVIIGDQATYFINWRNASSEPLADARIRVSFPSDFVLSDENPQPEANDPTTWDFGSVSYGGHGTITFHGVFMGALGTRTAIQAVGTYRPASFNSDFEALATQDLEYSDSLLTGALSVPQKALPGDKVVLSYALTNTSQVTLSKLEAHLTLPPGFVRDASSSTQEIDAQSIRIPLSDLVAGASTTVVVTGSFATGFAGDATVHAEAGHVAPDGTFLAAQKTDATFSVLSGDLTLSMAINGSNTDRSISYGDKLHATIEYQNTATDPINDVVIHVLVLPISSSGTTMVNATSSSTLDKAFIDWTHMTDSASGTHDATNTLSWGKGSIGVLEHLSPQQDGVIEFTLPTEIATGTTAGGFQVIAEATMSSVGTTPVDRTVKTAPMSFRFRTDADVSAQARYASDEGAPFGTGPLPPVSGQTTHYRLFWDLTKTVHELKNLSVSAVLPKDVAWSRQTTTTAGAIAYDDTTRTVTWALNRIPSDVNSVEATFDLDLTPTDSDVGRFVGLLGDTHIDVTDVTIDEEIQRSKPAITTNLENDESAKGKGVVIKP